MMPPSQLRPSDDWGYYARSVVVRFTRWRAFIKRRVPSLDTGRIT